MSPQLSSLAASLGICVVSALAIALLVITLYILGTAVFCIREFTQRAHDWPPLIGTVFRQLNNFDKIFVEHVNADPAVVEHVLKTNFGKYSRGAFNTEIVKDLFGNGIFVTDGDKWRHQRKLASHEFSTKVLRDYSSDVFRMNAVKLAEKTSSAAANRITINMQ
ncbi:hypothetical protein CFC21_095613 [Triticum aestivum]|uniref:Cytochrome P450 n=2 Tax=Triticum aestivum TaxID=4565 RepID=A0A9R1LQH6_WHEAT|nr:hypothetical protein CFC21_095613 [Triticum aestivum]